MDFFLDNPFLGKVASQINGKAISISTESIGRIKNDYKSTTICRSLCRDDPSRSLNNISQKSNFKLNFPIVTFEYFLLRLGNRVLAPYFTYQYLVDRSAPGK